MKVDGAMVVVAAIGDYDKSVSNPSPWLADKDLKDLNIRKDIENLDTLLGPEHLNYAVYPEGEEKFKTRWSEKELVHMLEGRAKDLNERIERGEHFDALVVVISGHGIKDNICTSDYQLVEKVAIHRIFSAQYPKLREIPRLFIFDCCDGDAALMDSDGDAGTDGGKNGTEGDTDKSFTVENVQHPYEIWVKGEKNPDHGLMEIHGANSGFQAKINSEVGSYLISHFVEKMLANEAAKEKKCICEVVDEIQTELAKAGKQQIVATYNDQTRNIIFERNTR